MDPAAIRRRVEALLLRSRRRLFGLGAGANFSKLQGNGLDFAELREYREGEDVRHINWKVTARAGRPYVNRFYEERELNVTVALAIDGAAAFGTRRTKQETMAEILALLGVAAVEHDDRFGALFFDSAPIRRVAPGKRIATVAAALEAAFSIDPIGRRLDLQALADELTATLKRPGLIFVIGDLSAFADLSALAIRHELYLIHVVDPFEEALPVEGELELEDPATGESVRLVIDAPLRRRWRERTEKIEVRWRAFAAEFGAEFCKISTREDPYAKLREMLK